MEFPKGASNPGSQLCFAWGKVRDQNSLILFDPGSTDKFISVDLARQLGIQIEEMGLALEAMGAFKGEQVPVTPLIGKLRIHVQNFVDVTLLTASIPTSSSTHTASVTTR